VSSISALQNSQLQLVIHISSVMSTKSKKEMHTEARAKALLYKNTKLSPIPKKTTSNVSTTPRKQNVPVPSLNKPSEFKLLDRANEYGREWQRKNDPSYVPCDRGPVSKMEPTQDSLQELKKQVKNLERIRNHAEAARKCLQERIDSGYYDL